MRLLELELENWVCHSSLRIDLSKGLQIEGRNGTGKSSILSAIRFMFTETATGYKTKIKNGARNARAILKFSKDSDTYIIEKELFTDKPSTAKLVCNSMQVADNPSSVYSALQSILREDVLDKLLYVPQGELASILIRLTRKEGRQELDNLFGLNKLDKVYKGAGDDAKAVKMESEFLSAQIAKYPEEAEKKYDTELESVGKELAEKENYIKTKEEELKSIDSEIKALEDIIGGLSEAKKEKDNLTEEANKLNIRIAEVQKELSQITSTLEEIRQKKQELQELQKTERALEAYVKIRELILRQEKCGERLSELADIPEKNERLNQLKEKLSEQWDTEEHYINQESKLRDLEAEEVSKKQRLNDKKIYLNELSSLEELPTCPRCGQKLTPEHLNNEKNTTATEITKLEKETEDLKTTLKNAGEEFNSIKDKLENLNKLEVEAKHLEKTLSEKAEQHEKISKELRDLDEELRDAGYDNSPIEAIENKVNEFREIHGKISIYEQEIGKEEGHLGKKRELDENLNKYSVQKKKHEERIGEIKYSDENLNSLRTKRDSVQESYYKIRFEIDKSNSQVNDCKNRIHDMESKKKEYVELKSKKDALDRKIGLLEAAKDVFHENKGIAKFLREKYIGELNSLLTFYFKRLNQNPTYTDAGFDKDYALQIKTTDGTLFIDQFSGGEKVQMALALRIALIEMLSPIRLLILDEPFGSLDREHREILGEALNKIASDGQLIIVTHVHVDSLQLADKVELTGY